jgi:hypothetical protein
LVRDAKETNGPIAPEMLWRNNIGSVETGMPDAASGLLVAAREHVSETADDPSPDGKCGLKRKIEDRGDGSGSLHTGAGGTAAFRVA